jgi:hypothetical protein
MRARSSFCQTWYSLPHVSQWRIELSLYTSAQAKQTYRSRPEVSPDIVSVNESLLFALRTLMYWILAAFFFDIVPVPC